MTIWQQISRLMAGSLCGLCLMVTPTLGQGHVSSETLTGNQTRFLATMADFPLLSGMVEIQNSAVTFDQPDLYYHQVQLVSWHPIGLVRHTYQQILPQLGWQMTGGGFQRARMKLSFFDKGEIILADGQPKAWLFQLEFSRQN